MVTVIKQNGQTENFSEKKIRQSARRVGIPRQLEDQLVEFVTARLYENISTREVFQLILEFLESSHHQHYKTRYGLKEAIMKLGPAGYIFERFVAQVLFRHDFRVKTNQILRGKCTNHEIDIIVEKAGHKHLVECKFHNKPGTRTDVLVPLYVHSRLEDLNSIKTQFKSAWVVTNTKLTQNAYRYGRCVGLYMISWNRPQKSSLADLVEESRLYPITILQTLPFSSQRKLLEQNQIFCHDLLSAPAEIWQKTNLNSDQIAQARSEIKKLLSLR